MPRQAPYLQRRGDTLFFRIAVPLDLRVLVGGRELTKTLRTADKREAIPVALEFAATAKRLFNDLRAGMAVADDSKLRELILKAKGDLRIKQLREQHDDALTDQRLRHLEELKRTQLEAETSTMKRLLADFAASDGRHPSPAHEIVPEGRIAAPKAAPQAQPQELHRLSDAIPVWRRLKNPSEGTVEVYGLAVRRFEGHFPELHIETIGDDQMVEYVDWLQAQGLTAKTIEKEHGAIRALLNIAKSRKWIANNPASGMLLPVGTEKKVRSYTPDELRQIFASPVFADGHRPKAGKGEAAYWVPLLLLHTGARREEICQLTTDRVRSSDGVPYLAIDPADDGGRLKTEESKRSIPIHDNLIKLGFLDFVGDRVKAGGGLLFPLLKSNKRGQYGAKWGDWWRRYIRESVKITDEQISPAHSFRHLFITECRRLDFREDYERKLVGHVRGGGRKDAHDGYGEHLVPALQAAINRIDFRGLDLSHLVSG